MPDDMPFVPVVMSNEATDITGMSNGLPEVVLHAVPEPSRPPAPLKKAPTAEPVVHTNAE